MLFLSFLPLGLYSSINLKTLEIMSKNTDTINTITEKMIAKMEQGKLDWNKPWNAGRLPQNFITRKAYSGFNLFSTMFSGYDSPFWLTANQIKKLGGSWSGQGTLVTFWNIGTYEKTDKVTGEKEEKNSFLLKYYYVWNAEQISGIDFTKNVPIQSELGTCEDLENVIANMPNAVNIKHTNSNQAYYTPTFDYINMPQKTQFKGTAEYYSTLVHEVIHSTGHSSRLNRMQINEGKYDSKKHDYSYEELVAEIGSSFLCAMYGVATEQTEKNSAAYLQSWLKMFKDDKQMLFKASTDAQKAVNYILNDVKQKDGSDEQGANNLECLNKAVL